MLKGSCLCGAVAYEVEALALPPTHCHCRTCQKAHSAAFATTAAVNREDFRWTRGEDVVRAYPSSPEKLRHFCGQCGSQLVAELKDKPQVRVRVATIDEGEIAPPTAHIWVDDQAAWDQGSDDLPRYARSRPS